MFLFFFFFIHLYYLQSKILFNLAVLWQSNVIGAHSVWLINNYSFLPNILNHWKFFFVLFNLVRVIFVSYVFLYPKFLNMAIAAAFNSKVNTVNSLEEFVTYEGANKMQVPVSWHSVSHSWRLKQSPHVKTRVKKHLFTATLLISINFW